MTTKTGIAVGVVLIGIGAAVATTTIVTDAGLRWWSAGLLVAAIGGIMLIVRLLRGWVTIGVAIGVVLLMIVTGIGVAALPAEHMDRITGSPFAWELSGAEEVLTTTTDGVVLTREGDPEDEWTLRARDVIDGQLEWRVDPAPFSLVRWVDDDVILLRPPGDAVSTTVPWRALSVADGDVLWEQPLRRTMRAHHDGIGLFTWPTGTEGPDEVSRQGVDLRTGDVVWSSTDPTRAVYVQRRALEDEASLARALPVLRSARVAVGDDDSTKAIDVATGDVLWSTDITFGRDRERFVDLIVAEEHAVVTEQDLTDSDGASADLIRGFDLSDPEELWSAEVPVGRVSSDSFWYQPWRLRGDRIWVDEWIQNRLRWVDAATGETGTVVPPTGWSIEGDGRLEDGITDPYVRVTHDDDDRSAFLDLGTSELIPLGDDPSLEVLGWYVVNDHLIVHRVDHNFVGERQERWDVLDTNGRARATIRADGQWTGQPWISGDHIVLRGKDSGPASVFSLS